MSSVVDYTASEYITWLKAENKYDAIEELALVFNKTPVCSDVKQLTSALKEREEIMSTGIGFGIAIPHAKISSVKEMAFAIGISKKGINFDSMDGEPVYLVIMVAAGEKQHKEYLRLLSNIMTVIKKDSVKSNIIKAKKPEVILELLKA